MAKNKTKNGAPIFDAMRKPLASFAMFKDGPKHWKKVAERRKSVYVHIAKHGLTGWPGIDELIRETGISRSRLFEYIADLKELCFIEDALDSEGRKYHGMNGVRVRTVHNDAVPDAATGWLFIKPMGCWVRIVKQESQVNAQKVVKQESQVREQESQVNEQESRLRRDTKEQFLDSNNKPCKAENNTIQTKEQLPVGWFDSFLQDMGVPSDAERENVKRIRQEHGDNITGFAVSDWMNRPQTIKGLAHPWSVFVNESQPYLEKAHRDCQMSPGLSDEELEAYRADYVKQVLQLDAPYYRDKLNEAKADYETNGALFDEPTRAAMLAQIEEYESRLAELAPKE
jgi:hypothetical protein